PISREVGYRQVEGLTFNGLCRSCRMLERFAEAIDYGYQALAIYREHGERHRECMALNNIGHVYQELGRVDEAIDCLEQALKIHRDVGDRWLRGRGPSVPRPHPPTCSTYGQGAELLAGGTCDLHRAWGPPRRR